MTDLHNRIEQYHDYIGSVSISYDYFSNFIGVILHTNNADQDISNVDMKMIIRLLDGSKVEHIFTSNDNGEFSYHYNLTKVESITIRAEIVTPAGMLIPVSHQVHIEHPDRASELLTISAYTDDYYLTVFGRLSDALGVSVSGVSVEVDTVNYDTDKVAKVKCTTDKNGEYSARFLAPDGDWEIRSTAIVKSEVVATSSLFNMMLRRVDQKFVVVVKTKDISSRYTGYATYPSSTPAPGGELEVISKNVWNEKNHYMGRIVRDNSGFYFAFYKVGATSNGSFGFPDLFQIDYSNRGYIIDSTLVVNDSEKYNMGKPSSYSSTHVYFDVTTEDGKRFFDKYFVHGIAPQTIKMDWVFRI